MNDLENYFRNNEKRLIHKWQHYFEIYDRHFNSFRNKEISVLEIGVSHGGSLQMWRDYFGEKAKIFGVDVNPHCKELEEDGIEIFIGSQEDRKFLRGLRNRIPPVDILIDDGGHTMKQQIYTFEELYDHVAPNGVYLCEDIHTSYWRDFGGGYKRKGTFVEFSKDLVDRLNAWHSEQKSKLDVTPFTRSAYALHFYDSILVIEKRPITPPFHLKTGVEVVKPYHPRVSKVKRLSSKLKNRLNIE
ncbi:MAG TPA: class I SAM-dependent methyltransferase [Syntrophorhabdaceae bacterium]|nr:class I SAM-dependent methyltransferase [Syntrophorhabdaceae bacterium]